MAPLGINIFLRCKDVIVDTDENDYGILQRGPSSSEDKKQSAFKKKILAERNEVSSTIGVEPSPSKLEKTLSPGSDSDKSSLSPYDPVKNYLSPRPQYLRYKPNRRREIFLHLEKEIKLKENSGSDDVHDVDSGDSNSDNTPASSVASLILEDIKKQENEECDDSEVIEEEEEKGGSSTLVGLLKFLLLIVVLALSTSHMCNMNTSLITWTNKSVEVENVCWSNQNSTFKGDTLQVLHDERVHVGHSDWSKFHVNFLSEDVSATVSSVDKTHTQHGDADELNLRVNEVRHDGVGGEDVSAIENSRESVDSSNDLVQMLREGRAVPDLEMRETEVGPNDLETENLEGVEVLLEEIEAGALELQMGEPGRSFLAVNTEDSEEVSVSPVEIEAEVVEAKSRVKREQIVDAVAELSSNKGILVGLMESKWILKALVGFSISSLFMTALFMCKKRVENDSSQRKDPNPEPVMGNKCEDFQVIRTKEEDKSLKVCASPSPAVKHLIMDEDRVSIHSRAPSVELLGEFVLEVSSSNKQTDVKSKTMESADRTHSISIKKKCEPSESSSMSSTGFDTTRRITSNQEVAVFAESMSLL